MSLRSLDAERALRSRLGEPIWQTVKVAGFSTSFGRIIGLNKEANGATRLWFRPPAPPAISGVVELPTPGNGNHNLKVPALRDLMLPDTLRVEVDNANALNLFIDVLSTPPIINSPLSIPPTDGEGGDNRDKAAARFLDEGDDELINYCIKLIGDTVEATVRNANGQEQVRTVKIKELRMSRAELDALIARLIADQALRCALTGLPLHFGGAGSDPNLMPSLDRIDSDGHYALGNLQIACRFANFWKSSSDDGEFRRLLQLVRDQVV